jgi:hypothetical protein
LPRLCASLCLPGIWKDREKEESACKRERVREREKENERGGERGREEREGGRGKGRECVSACVLGRDKQRLTGRQTETNMQTGR